MSGNEADAAAPGGLRSKWRTIMLVMTAALGALVLVGLVLTVGNANRERDHALRLQRHSYEVMDGWQRFPSVGRRQVQRQCSCCGFAQVKEVRIRRVREETWTKVPTVGRGSR